jgi:peptidyl-prolyl cis-trans isomerase C
LACGLGQASGEAAPDDVVATVNDEPVRSAEVRLVLPNVAAQLGPDQGQQDPERLFEAATVQVVNTKLLAQEARRREISIPAADLAGIMDQIENQSGGREALTEALTASGVEYDDLENTVRQGELAQRLIDTHIRPGVTVPDAEVESFYADNQEMFRTPAQVHARHILIAVGEGTSDEERLAARGRAEEVRRRAVGGADFAELARELSEGPSAKEGGDLGFFSAGSMLPSFSEAAFALDVGQISGVVETRYGFHVIKLEERRDAGIRPLDEVRDPLRNALVERKISGEVEALLNRLRSDATIVRVPRLESPDDRGTQDLGGDPSD